MRQGFSLVELSIVLVILGLLTGGILGGQALIRAAELRAVGTEYNRWMTATQTFRDKYFSIPGDMNNATQFWGRQANQAWCVTNSSAAVSSTGTCDGDSNGILQMQAAANQSGEKPQYWRQLALAGLIEGTFSGVAGAGGTDHCVIGIDCPRARLNNAGWSVSYKISTGNSTEYALDYSNYFAFGGQLTNTITLRAAIKPEEAWNIDTKMDDGRPAYGKVIAQYWNNACAAGGATASDLANSVYNLSNAATNCALNFVQAF